MRLTDLPRPLKFEIDASKYRIGCVLQDVYAKLIPCCYYSRTATELEGPWGHSIRLKAKRSSGVFFSFNVLDLCSRAQVFATLYGFCAKKYLACLRSESLTLSTKLSSNMPQYRLLAHFPVRLSDGGRVTDTISVRATFISARDVGLRIAHKAESCVFSVDVLIVPHPAIVAAPIPITL